MHRALLEQSGYRITVAGSGTEAVAFTKEKTFDVICMDVNMPGMNGIEATALIRASANASQHTPIIGVTSYDEDREKICLEKGMNAVVNKPVILDQLLRMIEEHTRHNNAIA
jgi:CheY-like chemotaxis protein